MPGKFPEFRAKNRTRSNGSLAYRFSSKKGKKKVCLTNFVRTSSYKFDSMFIGNKQCLEGSRGDAIERFLIESIFAIENRTRDRNKIRTD